MDSSDDQAVELFVGDEEEGGNHPPRASALRYKTSDQGVILNGQGLMCLPFDLLQRVGVTFDKRGDAYVSMWRSMEEGVMVVRFARYESWLGERRKVNIFKKQCKIGVIQAYNTPRQRADGMPMMSEIMFPWFFETRTKNHAFRYKPYLRKLSEPWLPQTGEYGKPIELVLEMQYMGQEPNHTEKLRAIREEKMQQTEKGGQ